MCDISSAFEAGRLGRKPQDSRPEAATAGVAVVAPAAGSKVFRRQQQPSNVAFQRHQFTSKQLKLAGGVKKPALLQKQHSLVSSSASQLQAHHSRASTLQRQQQQQALAQPTEAEQQLWQLMQRKLLQLQLRRRQQLQLQHQHSFGGSDASSSECCGADSASPQAAAATAAQLQAALAALQQQQQQRKQQDEVLQGNTRSSLPMSVLYAAAAPVQLQQAQQQQQQQLDISMLLQPQPTANLTSEEVDSTMPAATAAAAAPALLSASSTVSSSASVVRALLVLASTHVSPMLGQTLKQELLSHIRSAAAAAEAAGRPFFVAHALQAVLPGLKVAVLKACTETQVCITSAMNRRSRRL
jgi:hypothetical protein